MDIYPENSIILAPLAGFTDLPYRRSARRHGCKYAFTEMVDATSLVFGNEKTLRFLKRDETDKWLGIQLVGSDPETLEAATDIANQYDFDIIDFNLGCPAPKVVKKGEGAALGLNTEKALRAFEAIKTTSKVPATVKLRIVDRDDPAPTIHLLKKLEEAGASAITIHGRVMRAFYTGAVAYDIIAAAKASLSIPVIANGGIMDTASYTEARAESTCSSVMLARGAMGNPWIFQELPNGDCYMPPTLLEFADEMEQHIFEMVDFYGETLALKVARKVILDYMKGRGFPGVLKSKVSFITTVDDFKSFMVEIRKGPAKRYWKMVAHQIITQRCLRP